MNQGTIAIPTYFHRENDVRTAELSDACKVASRLFTPHRVEYTGRSRRLDARLSASRIGGVYRVSQLWRGRRTRQHKRARQLPHQRPLVGTRRIVVR